MDDIKREAQRYRNKIYSINASIEESNKAGKKKVYKVYDHWEELYENVNAILCSLNSNEKTVLNVTFTGSGTIPKHTHNREQVIHVIQGEIFEGVRKLVVKEKDPPLVIPANEEHEIMSAGASLVITFEPPFPSTSNKWISSNSQ